MKKVDGNGGMNVLKDGRLSLIRRGLVRLTLILTAALVTPVVALAQTHASGKTIGVGLYGSNGHQINLNKFAAHVHARLVAVAAVRQTPLPAGEGKTTRMQPKSEIPREGSGSSR